MTSTPAAPLVLFVAFPGMGLLDLTGPQTVFWCAAKRMAERGLVPYERHTVSADGGLVVTAEGVALDTLPAAQFAGRAIDTILVPGAPGISAVLADVGTTVDWIAGAAPHARRVTSVCTGAFLLAQGGLLDGRRVATHWNMADVLEQRFPALEVDREAIFVRQDPVWTSAGVTAGIDLALHLVAQVAGHRFAAAVARTMVIYLRRSGADPQLSPWMAYRNHIHPAVHRVQDAIIGDPTWDWSAVQLADIACTSERHLTRLFREHAGTGIVDYLQRIRIALARELLTQSGLDIERVAERAGFNSSRQLRRVWSKFESLPPSRFRGADMDENMANLH